MAKAKIIIIQNTGTAGGYAPQIIIVQPECVYFLVRKVLSDIFFKNIFSSADLF